jgi:hypothetical protein
MQRLLGLGVLFAASAAAAEPPIATSFALREALPAPVPDRQVEIKFETPQIDYSEPARPDRKQGFLAAVQVAPNSYFGIGMSDRKPQRSGLAPDPQREGRRGGKKLALRFTLRF